MQIMKGSNLKITNISVENSNTIPLTLDQMKNVKGGQTIQIPENSPAFEGLPNTITPTNGGGILNVNPNVAPNSSALEADAFVPGLGLVSFAGFTPGSFNF